MSEMDEFDKILDGHHEVQRLHRTRQWKRVLQAVKDNAVIDYYDEPVYDKWGTATAGEWGGYLIQVMPMIYNDRLVMTPKAHPFVYDYGWCYPKGPAALLAALTWDPDEFGEPHGFIKRIGTPRAAGARADRAAAE
jgi:hypothetical protein